MTAAGVIVALICTAFVFAIAGIRWPMDAVADSLSVRMPDNIVRRSDSLERTLVVDRPARERTRQLAALSSWAHARREIDRALLWWLEDPVDDRDERDPVSALEQARMKLHSRLRELAATVEPRTKST